MKNKKDLNSILATRLCNKTTDFLSVIAEKLYIFQMGLIIINSTMIIIYWILKAGMEN